MNTQRDLSIVVRDDPEYGLVHVTSPDLKELFISSETLENALASVRRTVEAIREAQGICVRVTKPHRSEGTSEWTVTETPV